MSRKEIQDRHIKRRNNNKSYKAIKRDIAGRFVKGTGSIGGYTRELRLKQEEFKQKLMDLGLISLQRIEKAYQSSNLLSKKELEKYQPIATLASGILPKEQKIEQTEPIHAVNININKDSNEHIIKNRLKPEEAKL